MKNDRGTHDFRNSTAPVAGPIHILIAEDEPLLAKLMTLILQAQGWRVTCVNDGDRAVRAWEKGNFDLILMDLQMPNMDGLEAARIIRGQEKRFHVPILALTATEKHWECLKAGMDGFMAKPFFKAELIEMISRHLNS